MTKLLEEKRALQASKYFSRKKCRARESRENDKLRRKGLNSVNVMALLCKTGWQRRCRTQAANKLWCTSSFYHQSLLIFPHLCGQRGGASGSDEHIWRKEDTLIRLTTNTRTFMSRSMLVRLKVVFPLFCMSFVSGPGDEAHLLILVIKLSCSKADSLWGPTVLFSINNHCSSLEVRYTQFRVLVGNLGRNRWSHLSEITWRGSHKTINSGHWLNSFLSTFNPPFQV